MNVCLDLDSIILKNIKNKTLRQVDVYTASNLDDR